MNDRGRVQLSDVIMTAVVVIAAARMSPAYMDLIADLTETAGPLTDILLELVVPSIFIGIIISIGVSAVREEHR